MGNPILKDPVLSSIRVILPLDLTNVLKNDTGSWRKDIQIKKFLVKLSMISLGNDKIDIECRDDPSQNNSLKCLDQVITINGLKDINCDKCNSIELTSLSSGKNYKVSVTVIDHIDRAVESNPQTFYFEGMGTSDTGEDIQLNDIRVLKKDAIKQDKLINSVKQKAIELTN